MAKLKLTEKTIEKAQKGIAIGTPQKYVAQSLGISEEAWYSWMRRGEHDLQNDKDDTIFAKFYESVKKAQAKSVSRCVSMIQKASIDTWQAAAWWLERRYPEEFGRKEKVDVSGVEIHVTYDFGNEQKD